MQAAARFLVSSLSAKRWLCAFSLILIESSTLYGQQVPDWLGPDNGSWFTPTNWSSNELPTSNQNAVVDNGTTAQIPVPPQGIPFARALTLTIGATTDGSTVKLFGGDLGSSAEPVSVTIDSHGTFEFSGGLWHGGSMEDNGTILFDTAASQTLHGVSGSGRIIIGEIALTLDGDNTFNGETTVTTNGSLQIGTGGTIGSIAGNIANNGTLIFDRSDSITFNGAISGTGNLVKSAGDTLTLSGTNTYAGTTTVNAGVLEAGSTSAFSPNSAFIVNAGAFLNLNGFDSAVGSLSGAGVVTNSGGFGVLRTATLSVGFDNMSTTFTGTLQDGVSTLPVILALTKVGTGTLSLTSDNSYSGGTNLNGGVLAVIRDASLGTGQLTFDGGTLEALAAGGGITSDKVITLNAGGGTFLADAGTTSTLNGLISGVGAWTKAGPGISILTNTDSYLGGTTITGGTLQLGNGGTTGSITGDVTDQGVFAVNRSNTYTFAGVISGSGSFEQRGTGTTILIGDSMYNGGTTITAGTLQLGNGGTTGSIIGDITNNGILAFNRSNTLTFGGMISGTGSVQQNGTGTTVLAGNSTYIGGTTIDAGTLQLGNGGTTGSIIGNVIDNGILAFDRSDVLTFGGAISGTGGVTQIGTGATILTGDNTYTGGTTISAGTLQLGNGGTTGSIAGEVVDNGILALNRSDVVTFGGVISGTGSVQQIGTGTTVLTGNNTYSGGTTVSAGTLQLGNGGTTGSITGNVVDNGILAFNRSDVVTFDGLISGTGSVQQIGTGTTILTGNTTYSGGTTVSAGTLQLGNGGTTGSITGNVIDNGILAFNRSDSVIFNGMISGTGDLQQNGTGTTVLVTDNTYTGTTTVNAGRLIVNGSIASAQTLVNTGAFLGGHGTIGGNVVNSGIVGQFNAPGTLTITGNYIQNPGGTLQIQIAGVGATQHDLLAINGHANLAGNLQLIPLGGFNLSPGDRIVFLTANNGVSGTFNNVQTGTIVQAAVTTLPNGVVLEGKQGSFAATPGVATTPNNVAVAQALDSAAGDPRAAAPFAFLNSQPLANLPHQLTLIAPIQISSMNATSLSLEHVQASNVGRRLANVHAGSTGFSAAGFTINGSTPSFSGGGFAGPTGAEGKAGSSVLAPVPENRWGVFLTGLGEFTNVDSTSNAPGYNVDTGGFTLGVDYRLTPNLVIGLLGGYAHNSIDLVGGGNIDVNSGQIGVYGTVFGNGFYLDTAVSAGPSGYSTRRTALQGTASGSTDGTDVDFLIAGGYDWKIGNLTIGPTANFQFGYVGLDSFTETGSLAPLKFPDQNTESERTAFGGKATYNWKIGHIIVIPQFTAAWQHEYGSVAYSVIASFASGAGSSFTVSGPQIGRDSLLIGAGASVLWSDRISTYVYYDGELGRTNYDSHSVSGGIRITF